MMLSNADMSTAEGFVAGLFHDWLDVVPVGPHDTEPGNIAEDPAPAAGGCIEVLRSVEERSLTDVFAVVVAVVTDDDICSAG